MANLIAAVNNGPWTTPGTWMKCEAGSGAAQLVRTASTETTSSYVWSSAFTCTNLDVMDGVLLCLKRVGTSGTVTVGISADNGATAAKEVTVNASDIPADQTMMFFKFPSTLTADGGTDYKIGVKESAGGSGATVYRDATAGNWFHLIRLTAAPGADPAAGDNIFVAGEWTAATATTPINVVMDSTDSTDHGTLDVGQGGSITSAVSASTIYILQVSGDINIWSGGTISQGTVSVPMPSTSTMTIILDCASNVQWGLIVRSGGTHIMQGASKIVWTYLAADAAVNATSLTTADSTAWASGDLIALPTTRRLAATEAEQGDLNGAASGTTLTVHGFGGVGGGLAYVHSGTAPTRAAIINLTRNVSVRGASAAYQGYILVESSGNCNWDYAEFTWMGSGTAGKRGIEVRTESTGSFVAAYCSFYNFIVANSDGIFVSGASGLSVFTITDCVFYNIAASGISVSVICSSSWSITNNVFIKSCGTNLSTVELSDLQGTFTGNVLASGTGHGITFNASGPVGTFSSNIIHSHGLYGLRFYANISPGSVTFASTFTNFTCWRNSSGGAYFTASQWGTLIFDTWTMFGNATDNIAWATLLHVLDLRIKSLTSSGDTSYATTNGLHIQGPYTLNKVTLDNCDFSTVTGIMTAHTNDVPIDTNTYTQILSRNTKVNGGTLQYDVVTDQGIGSYIAVQRYNRTAGDHRNYQVYGTIRTDSVIYNSAAPSERITPNSATVKIESGKATKTIDNGGTVTFGVWVRKSKIDDPTAGDVSYTGNNPRLIIKANPALGSNFNADIVADTLTEAVGEWHFLTYTTGAATDDGAVQAVVDCDGTAGWINVDDWQ